MSGTRSTSQPTLDLQASLEMEKEDTRQEDEDEWPPRHGNEVTTTKRRRKDKKVQREVEHEDEDTSSRGVEVMEEEEGDNWLDNHLTATKRRKTDSLTGNSMTNKSTNGNQVDSLSRTRKKKDGRGKQNRVNQVDSGNKKSSDGDREDWSQSPFLDSSDSTSSLQQQESFEQDIKKPFWNNLLLSNKKNVGQDKRKRKRVDSTKTWEQKENERRTFSPFAAPLSSSSSSSSSCAPLFSLIVFLTLLFSCPFPSVISCININIPSCFSPSY